jgi:hypothetical protein
VFEVAFRPEAGNFYFRPVLILGYGQFNRRLQVVLVLNWGAGQSIKISMKKDQALHENYDLLRRTLSVVSGVPFSVSVICFSCAWFIQQGDVRFQKEGITVPAELAGYKYLYGKQSGDRPMLRYIDHYGISHEYLATEYGVAGQYAKKTLPLKKIEITYLRNQPDEARVEKWRANYVPLTVSIGCIAAFVGIAMLLFVRLLRKASVTPSFDG